MSLLAVATAHPSAAEKLQQIPPAFWLKVGAAVLIVVVAVILLRKLAEVNKVVLAVIGLVLFSTLGFSWIYNRNEPAWARPVVEKLAGFFPSKGTYATKQQGVPRR
jgi:hypothetical protein